jgi:hypothetical protein
MAVMDRPDDRERKNKTASLKIPSLKNLSIDELMDLRNHLKKKGEDISNIDIELKSRFS